MHIYIFCTQKVLHIVFFLNPDSQEENDGVVGARGRKKRLMFPPFLSDKRGKTKIRVASPCKRGQGQGRRGPGFPSLGSSQRSSARGSSAGSRGWKRSASNIFTGARQGERRTLRIRTRISWTGFPPDFSCFTISAPEGHGSTIFSSARKGSLSSRW